MFEERNELDKSSPVNSHKNHPITEQVRNIPPLIHHITPYPPQTFIRSYLLFNHQTPSHRKTNTISIPKITSTVCAVFRQDEGMPSEVVRSVGCQIVTIFGASLVVGRNKWFLWATLIEDSVGVGIDVSSIVLAGTCRRRWRYRRKYHPKRNSNQAKLTGKKVVYGLKTVCRVGYLEPTR